VWGGVCFWYVKSTGQHASAPLTAAGQIQAMHLGIGMFTGIFALASLIPSLSVSVRRLHDTGRSGWWLLIGLIPLVGVIILLVFFAQDSEAGANRFGANPKAAAPGRSIGAAAPGKPWSAPQVKR
jgi:uncharacterized membrane protein YhaH (DUF805 family)